MSQEQDSGRAGMYATVIREKPKLSPRIDGSSLYRLIRRLMDSRHILLN